MEKIQKQLDSIESSINKLKEGDVKFIFFSPDTKGFAKGSVAYMYKIALTLKNNGHQAIILHEKNDYIKVGGWLGNEYDDIEHISIEDNKLVVGPNDFIFIPEIYADLFAQMEQLPVTKIILVQNFANILDAFSLGKSWADHKVDGVLTTTEKISEMIVDLVPNQKPYTLSPYFEEYFKPPRLPKKPIVAIHCRDQKKAAKLIKTFYLKFPMFRFISFIDMHGMTEKDFALNLSECALAVWVDDDSTFGTFPIECMLTNTPVVGKVPIIIPEWMDDKNGMWVHDEYEIPDIIFNFMKNWLEDTLPDDVTHPDHKITDKYNKDIFTENLLKIASDLKEQKIKNLETIKDIINKKYEK